MPRHTFFGKQKLCYTEVTDFTDYQGIGHDPLYKRYDSVFSVVKRFLHKNYQHFLATPEYVYEEDRIYWHIECWNETPVRLTELTGVEFDRYKSILEDTVNEYKSSLKSLSGEDLQILSGAIKYVDEGQVFCSDGKVYLVAWGMAPDKRQHKVVGSVIHNVPNLKKKFKIVFDAGEYGTIPQLDKRISKEDGTILTDTDLPKLSVSDGWQFIRWVPNPIGQKVSSDMTFTAEYEPKTIPVPKPPCNPIPEPTPLYYSCRFISGENGFIPGSSNIKKEAGSTICNGDIPKVIPNKGYKFKGWNISPYNMTVDEDKTFVAQYEKNSPWYTRCWSWLKGLWIGKGCLKWLLWLLLFVLLCWLLSWILSNYRGCVGPTPINGVVPIDTISRTDGRIIDDNGNVRPITGNDGVLPGDNVIVAPVMGEGGDEPPIVNNPGAPDIIANRLFLFLENENDDVDLLARDFKKAYPGDEYSIIGYDKEVKSLVIQVPANERETIRKTIKDKIPNHKFIVFDEEVYERSGTVNNSAENIGWHLDAIHLKQGWAYTKGRADIRVAIVDDGIQASHPMFKGRIVDAYNVYTQNNSLSVGDGHGTHVAGLAAGSDKFYSDGASGIAPNCKIMPVQVFDNKYCPLSALVSGIMYAIHHDADVVNISIGPSFKGLNTLPVEQQEEIAKNQFQNGAFLWNRICKLAAKKNTILIFAAGNDNIISSIPPENRSTSSIVVTAVDKRLYQTEFTNYGTCSDVSAPGKEIYSSYLSDSFISFDGTSMAAPIVAGTIALMKSLKKDLTVEQARNVLYSTGADVYGRIPPMVLVDKAIEATQKGDFRRIERKMRPIPGDESTYPVDGSQDDEIISNPDPIPNAPGNETDYDAIIRKIAEYKEKINELEKLLPNNK